MKRFNRRDLSLNPRDIMSLDGKDISSSNYDLGSQVNCMTVPTNCDCHTKDDCDTETQCHTIAECATEYTFCPEKTYNSNCICLTDNKCDYTVECADTASHGPVCCELPETRNGVCLQPSLNCVLSVDQCLYTETCPIPATDYCNTLRDDCPIITTDRCEATDACQLSVDFVCIDTFDCDDETKICLQTGDDDCEYTDQDGCFSKVCDGD